ncbi:MAG: hypothetical protein J5797_08180 [Prevotella sp.]|nr:hypothetical protein [Prevotella sp.]
MAQAIAKGYYRVKNWKTESYIMLTDYKTTGVNWNATSYDVHALRTRYGFERVCNDPSSVYYIENVGGTNYNLKGQGKSVHDFVGRYLTVRHVAGTSQSIYTASGIYEGIEVYLMATYDPYDMEADGMLTTQKASDPATGSYANELKWWWVKPVSANDDDNYFGIQPEVTVSGKRYAPFYASFPFTPAASGMKVYTVTKVDGNMAVYTEVQGRVAGGTPVIIACPGATPSDNRINLDLQDGTKPAGNLLVGEYFNSSDFYEPGDFHYNALPWDAATMRILGITKEGKLGFIKSTALKTIPRNKAYLTVSADAPDEITLMTQAEYEEEKARAVTITARSYSREYGEANPVFEYDVNQGTMTGEPTLTCEATPSSPVGTYPIVIGKGTVTNSQFTAIDGTLTVTKAPLTITAKSYTIKQNESLPAFEADYAGFKLGETASTLAVQPVLNGKLPETTYIPVGTYEITVSGAESQNYDIAYVAGTLTVMEADPVTLTAVNATMVYGDALPEFTFTVSGGELQGTPAITCEANAQSPVGTYDIVIAAGNVAYPNLVLVNGILTVTPASLTASVGNYKRLQGESNPEFVINYKGFKNGEDASVFIAAPTATCEATADSAPGSYDIIVSGGEALNYEFAYVNGVLEVIETQGIAAVTDRFDKPVDIYTLDGRCIRRATTTMTGLPRGLYIVDGRKVVVR